MKKKGKRDLLKLEDKNLLKILGRKRPKKKKKNLDWIGRARKGKKLLKRFEKCEENMREKSFKKLTGQFSIGQKIVDQSSTNQAPIEPGRL